jgi:hypothetical protein
MTRVNSRTLFSAVLARPIAFKVFSCSFSNNWRTSWGDKFSSGSTGGSIKDEILADKYHQVAHSNCDDVQLIDRILLVMFQ